MKIGDKVKGFINKARNKYEEKATNIRQRKNQDYARELQELKRKREQAEGQAKLIETRNKERERIAKARKTIYNEKPVVKGLKAIKGAVGEVRKQTSKDFGAKNNNKLGGNFNDKKLRL